MHSCKHGNRTQTLFLRGQNRFASQFSANHIQFRIAKLRFCIANCDAIPDKFIPAVNIYSVPNHSSTVRLNLRWATPGTSDYLFLTTRFPGTNKLEFIHIENPLCTVTAYPMRKATAVPCISAPIFTHFYSVQRPVR